MSSTFFVEFQQGYGVIYPSTGANNFFVPHECVAVGVIGSLEAYLGLLYVGFCAAILFGKVTRAQSHAQVLFSDPIVVRFGREELVGKNESVEITEEKEEEKDDEEAGGGVSSVAINENKKEEEKNIPCPSLEFRLMNRLHNVDTGEIGKGK